MITKRWKPLSEYAKDILPMGVLFRHVRSGNEFLLIQYPDAESRFAMIYHSGRDAGRMCIVLPPEAANTSTVGICADWLMDHWTKWIDPQSTARDIEIKRM